MIPKIEIPTPINWNSDSDDRDDINLEKTISEYHQSPSQNLNLNKIKKNKDESPRKDE